MSSPKPALPPPDPARQPPVPAVPVPRAVLTGLLAGAARYAGTLLAGWVYARWHD